MACTATLSLEPIAADAELAAFIAAADGAGAVASFCGLARPTAKDGSVLDLLHLDHHPRLTEPSLQAIAESGRDRFALDCVAIVHRCGAIRPGETIVFVATAAAHRRAAFESAEYVMDRLKTDAIFWKREEGPGGTPLDRADCSRPRRRGALGKGLNWPGSTLRCLSIRSSSRC